MVHQVQAQPEPEPEGVTGVRARARPGTVQRGEGRKADRARLVFKLPPTMTESPVD
eukprot:COSAG04_NODE_14564_length_563_cov_0.754310_1_plen_55_part_10